MENSSKMGPWSIGFAMFSMYFGAGNIAFPIALGQYAGSNNIYAILGLLLTAVIMPFIGLCVMLMYNGDYKSFLGRIGPIPGFIVAIIIMLIIGPMGAMPRCVSLSYSTINLYVPSLSVEWFSFGACIIIFALSYQKSKVMDILGRYLTPVLLLSLAVIIMLGLWNAPAAAISKRGAGELFAYGLVDGYNTMDIFASIFFAIVVIPAFKQIFGQNLEKKPKAVADLAMKSSLVGVFLLGIIYTSMSFIASYHAADLTGHTPDQYLGAIANHVLGPYAGLIANIAVSLACLTTAISLAVVFAEFLREDIFKGKFGYTPLLLVTIIVNYFFSLLGFSGIVKMVGPALVLLCPATIMLVFCNMAYRLWGFKYVKTPVYGTFAITVLLNYL